MLEFSFVLNYAKQMMNDKFNTIVTTHFNTFSNMHPLLSLQQHLVYKYFNSPFAITRRRRVDNGDGDLSTTTAASEVFLPLQLISSLH